MPPKRSPKQLEYRKEAIERIKSARDLSPEIKLTHCSEDIAWQNRIGDELMEWADKEDSLVLDSFAVSKHIAPRWFYNMAKKNDYFAQCLSYAKSSIGMRLQYRLLKSKIEGSHEYMIKQLSKVDALWIEAEENKNKSIEEQKTVVQYYAPNWQIKGDKVEVIEPPMSSVSNTDRHPRKD